MRRNVTLALSEETIRQARHLAVEKGVSLSRLLSDYLEEMVLRSQQYVEAKKKAVGRMKRGLPMGVGDHIPWSRDEIHER